MNKGNLKVIIGPCSVCLSSEGSEVEESCFNVISRFPSVTPPQTILLLFIHVSFI